MLPRNSCSNRKRGLRASNQGTALRVGRSMPPLSAKYSVHWLSRKMAHWERRITPPAAAMGRARDFFCRVTLTDSSLPTVTLSGATIDIGATEVAGMTQGVNLLMFTEIASGHWLASRRSAS